MSRSRKMNNSKKPNKVVQCMRSAGFPAERNARQCYLLNNTITPVASDRAAHTFTRM